MHLFDVQRNFYGGNAIVASHLPLAVGMALAVRKRGEHHVVCCFFGDGAAAEGEFAESLNLAALWNVPVLFVCENNLYAMGTALKYSHAATDLVTKGTAQGVESMNVDGMDLCVEPLGRISRRGGCGHPYGSTAGFRRFGSLMV